MWLGGSGQRMAGGTLDVTALRSGSDAAPALCGAAGQVRLDDRKGRRMAAMKPRTGDGPLEVTKEGRGIVMRVPLEGGGRLVVELTPDEAKALGKALDSAVG